jgi:hypothetical protein
MKQISLTVDLGWKQYRVPALLIDDVRVVYTVESSVWMVKVEHVESNQYLTKLHDLIQLGEINENQENNIEFLRKLVNKMKRISLYEYLISDEFDSGIDYDFNLTKEWLK